MVWLHYDSLLDFLLGKALIKMLLFLLEVRFGGFLQRKVYQKSI